jgi:hypothetical protein
MAFPRLRVNEVRDFPDFPFLGRELCAETPCSQAQVLRSDPSYLPFLLEAELMWLPC